jgi:hypothetical protein
MYVDRELLELLRSLAIQLVRALDKVLGYPPTIPSKHERRVLAIQEREGVSR